MVKGGVDSDGFWMVGGELDGDVGCVWLLWQRAPWWLVECTVGDHGGWFDVGAAHPAKVEPGSAWVHGVVKVDQT
ncbi:hypothetical protein V6N13_055588 [Hibiscus sabdariffa]